MTKLLFPFLIILLGLSSCKKDSSFLDETLFGVWNVDRLEVETYQDGILEDYFTCLACGEIYFGDDGSGYRSTSLGYQNFRWENRTGRTLIYPSAGGGQVEEWIMQTTSPTLQLWNTIVYYDYFDPLIGDVQREDRMYMDLVR